VNDVCCIDRIPGCAVIALAIVAVLAGAGCSSSGSPGKPAVTSAASVPFPVAVGNTWKYKVTGNDKSATVTEKMTSVVPVTGGRKVTMTVTSNIAATTARTETIYFFHSDGSITSSPPSQARQRNVVTISSDSDIIWPSATVIDSGRPVKLDVPVTLQGAERTYRTTEHITIQSAGTATVTVPAGTYRAPVASETITFSFFGIGRPVTSYVKTWLAPGVGLVQEQQALINTAGSYHVVAALELESFSKG
jgi:hypothetical protein